MSEKRFTAYATVVADINSSMSQEGFGDRVSSFLRNDWILGEFRVTDRHMVQVLLKPCLVNYFTAAAQMIERHDEKARAANFDKCGCDDCTPFRASTAKATEQC